MLANSKTWYEIQYETFHPSFAKGVGDFLGIVETIPYLQNLNVKYLVINDIFAIYQKERNFSLETIQKTVGSVADFAILVAQMQKAGIKIVLKFNLLEIGNTWKAYQRMLKLENQEEQAQTQAFALKTTAQLEKHFTESYFLETETADFENDWGANNNFENFSELITYLNYLGVYHFSFYNYEYLYDRQQKQVFNEITRLNLKRIYQLIKKLNPDNYLIWSNQNISTKVVLKTLKNLDNYCDFYFDEQLHKLCYDKHFLQYQQKALAIYQLRKQLIINSALKEHINSLGAAQSGRLFSLVNQSQLFDYESSASWTILNWFHPSQRKIYFGEEIGMLNLKTNFLEEIHDFNLNEKKRYYAHQGLSKKAFLKAYANFHHFNSHYPMMWEASSNQNSKYILKREEINVNSQFQKRYSLLKLNLALAFLFNDPKFNELIKDARLTFKPQFSFRKLIHGQLKSPFLTLSFYLNLTAKQIRCKIDQKEKILLSSYHDKIYTQNPQYLDPYESLVVLKNSNDQNYQYLDNFFKEFAFVKNS